MPLKNITTGFEAPLLSGAGELRVSNASPLFEDRHNYNVGNTLWETVDNVNGTVSHLPNESGVSLSIPSASGDKITRQTYQHFNYVPGQVLKFEVGFKFPTQLTGLRARAGAFTTGNGIYLERADANVRFVRRTSVTGSPVNNTVSQASWNVDPLDGTGPSKKTLNLAQTQMMFIRYGWYGAGNIEVGFLIEGERIIAHRFATGNNLSAPWSSTGNLPLRYEIENTSGTLSSSEMKTYGASVVTEGKIEIDRGFLFTTEGTATAASGTRTHVLSVRPRTTFNSITNRSLWELESIDILVTGNNPIKWEVGFGHTLTSPSWTNVNTTYSASEFDTSGTINTGPTIVTESGYTSASATTDTALRISTKNILPLTLDASGAQRALGTIGVFATGLGGASACRAILNWREVI